VWTRARAFFAPSFSERLTSVVIVEAAPSTGGVFAAS
jgi:hypothetical protein